jgi:hypothetical protein
MRWLLVILLLSLVPTAFAGTQTVGTVTIDPSSPIDLTLGSTKTVTCSATITDTDNWNNITTVNATIWDSIASTEGASDNDNEHYTVVSCDLGANTSATERPATCSFSLHYHANPSTWTCKIRSYNSTNDLASNSNGATVNQLVALDVVGTSINFGDMALNETSASDVSTTVQNVGNIRIDVKLSGDSFSCSSGTLSPETARYSATSGNSYASMTELTGTAITLDLDIAKSTGSPSTKDTYWKISIPNSGVGGSCSNTVTFSAVSG